jgi:hypothetical protein
MRLRAIVVGLALVSTAAGAAVSDAQGSAAPERTVIYGGGFKPRRFHVGNHTLASGVRWSLWTSTVAIGTGLTKLCLAPSGGRTHCTTTRQTMVYTQPRRECGEDTFTRLTYSKWSFRDTLSVDGKNAFGKTFCLWSTG